MAIIANQLTKKRSVCNLLQFQLANWHKHERSKWWSFKKERKKERKKEVGSREGKQANKQASKQASKQVAFKRSPTTW